MIYNKNGYGSKKYKIKITEAKNGDVIHGPDGDREGIRVHQWNAHYSEGCFTTGVNDKDGESVYTNVINKIPSLTAGKDVRIIVEERNAVYDEKKQNWIGVEDKDGVAASSSAASPAQATPPPQLTLPDNWSKFELKIPKDFFKTKSR